MGINYRFSAPYGINNSNTISAKINYLKQNDLNYSNSDFFLTGYAL